MKETQNDEREVTAKENHFINVVLENYPHSIMTVLNNGNALLMKHRHIILLSEDNEVLVQIGILLENETELLGRFHISGKCEMSYNDKYTSFKKMDVLSITNALKELGFEDAGFHSVH